MNSQEEFVVGKHGIGYIGSYFKASLYGQTFDPVQTVSVPVVLPRSMKDAEIEKEITNGKYATLGDVLAVLDSEDPAFKDGNLNLFYLPSFVVRVDWDGGEWDVRAYDRDDSDWPQGRRVFCPRN